MNKYQLEFPGEITARGFWIYVYKITHDSSTYYYVGRTGDSSSTNASSPFKRMLSHFSNNKKGNALTRNLNEAKIPIESSEFKLYSFGPLYPEQENWHNHQKYRDLTATVEFQVAIELIEKGYKVIGTHSIETRS
jgi:hypothetical protein